MNTKDAILYSVLGISHSSYLLFICHLIQEELEGAFKLVRMAWAPCLPVNFLVKRTGCPEDRSGVNYLLEMGIISEFWRSLVRNRGGGREPSDTDYQLLKIA